jgi:uncharacterized lipoprotein YddW (UPF0748 family)
MPGAVNKNRFLLTLIVVLASATLLLSACNEANNGSKTEAVVESNQPPFMTQPDEPEEAVSSTATLAPEPTPTSVQEQVKPARLETRALWSRIEADQKKITKADLDALIAKMDQAHLNVLLFKVYHDGTAFFELSQNRFSNKEERLPNRSAFVEEGYRDALSYLMAVRNARRADSDPFNDFEVHAWISVMMGGKRGEGWPQPDKTKPYMLHALFPEFKLKYGAYYQRNDERFARHDTSVVQQPKFRAYIINMIAGLVEDYGVDGIHLDHIRTNGLCFNNEPLDYPGAEYDYAGCQEDYKQWTRATYGQEYTLWDDTDGHKEIQDGGSGRVAAWQERTMNNFVQSIHDEVKRVKPETIISVASVRSDPSPEARKQEINGQVAWEWLEKGWIDAAFVTTYTSDTQHVLDIVQRFRMAIPTESKRLNVFPGLLTYSLGTKEERSYLIAEQVNAVMYEQWAQPLEPPGKGIALFRAEYFSQEAGGILGRGPFKEPALPFWGELQPTPESLKTP